MMFTIKKFFIYLCTLILLTTNIYGIEVPAITIVPIADLVGDSLQNISNSSEITNGYKALPVCGHHLNGCLRLHQSIFNEQITIIEEKGDEVRIKITNLFFEQENSLIKYDTFWSLRSNFIPISELKKNNISLDSFPQPIIAQVPPKNYKTLTLIYPWYNKDTKTTYSAGTRFVIARKNNNKKTICVYVFNPHNKKVIHSQIPTSLYYINEELTDNHQKIQDFVSILKKWAHPLNGFIPYVWGGISFVTTCNDTQFTKKTVKAVNNLQTTVYSWPSCDHAPKSGFDCTGLVARAAQIVDIPYYFKNTTTLTKYLKPLAIDQLPEEGDLIWFPGHVLVIADCKQNTIIEARSYGQGFGKVHELPINKAFKGINSIQELALAFHHKKPLERLDSLGMPVQHITQFKIFSLKSVWRNNKANAEYHS